MMRFEAVEERLLVRQIGFKQHLDFVLLLQLAFPVVKEVAPGRSVTQAASFSASTLAARSWAEASSGAVHSTTTASGVFTSRPPHHESLHYITQDDWSLMKRAAERPDFNYFYNG
jgi:hypothetical protein